MCGQSLNASIQICDSSWDARPLTSECWLGSSFTVNTHVLKPHELELLEAWTCLEYDESIWAVRIQLLLQCLHVIWVVQLSAQLLQLVGVPDALVNGQMSLASRDNWQLLLVRQFKSRVLPLRYSGRGSYFEGWLSQVNLIVSRRGHRALARLPGTSTPHSNGLSVLVLNSLIEEALQWICLCHWDWVLAKLRESSI